MTHPAVQHQLNAASAEVIGGIACNLPVKGTEYVVMRVYELHCSFLLCHWKLLSNVRSAKEADEAQCLSKQKTPRQTLSLSPPGSSYSSCEGALWVR